MNITKKRSIWFSISASLVGAGILATIFFGFNLGLDFTGGARWTVDFEKEVSQTDLKTFFSSIEILEKEPQIQMTDTGEAMITIEDMSDEQIQEIAKKMEEGIGTFKEVSYRKVDSSIGSHFKTKAFYALITALIGIVLFVAFAFRRIPKAINPWRFGAVAIVALFHDIIIILGVFVILGYFLDIELDLPFLTAMLATLGFSVNDTIVILDRVRENIRLQKASQTFSDTIELSIQQTLKRSVNTSISTLLPLLALMFFGADSIFFFVMALTIGISIGTYSSIFIAAPLLVTWKNWSDRKG